MRNRAAALLILTLATSCGRTTRHDHRSATPATTELKTAPTSAAPPTTSRRQATIAPPSTSIGSRLVEPAVVPNVATAATRTVEQLIAGPGNAALTDADLWSAVVSGGRIIQTTVLAETADRATVAISIAFDPTPGEAAFEPIGLRVELLDATDGWNVIAIGYL